MVSVSHKRMFNDVEILTSVNPPRNYENYSDQPNSQGFPLPGLSLMYPDKGNFIAVVGKFS